MNNTPFIAVIFFILGSIACHLYKRHIISDLEDGLSAWRMQAEITSERLNNWRCLRPHIGDVNNIQQDTEDAVDLNLQDLLDELDAHIKNIKEMFKV